MPVTIRLYSVSNRFAGSPIVRPEDVSITSATHIGGEGLGGILEATTNTGGKAGCLVALSSTDTGITPTGNVVKAATDARAKTQGLVDASAADTCNSAAGRVIRAPTHTGFRSAKGVVKPGYQSSKILVAVFTADDKIMRAVTIPRIESQWRFVIADDDISQAGKISILSSCSGPTPNVEIGSLNDEVRSLQAVEVPLFYMHELCQLLDLLLQSLDCLLCGF